VLRIFPVELKEALRVFTGSRSGGGVTRTARWGKDAGGVAPAGVLEAKAQLVTLVEGRQALPADLVTQVAVLTEGGQGARGQASRLGLCGEAVAKRG
jgi:hypothetical protein